MVTIVKISVHEKKRHYYEVGVLSHDGSSDIISIHEDVLVAKGLRKGLEMTKDELRELLKLESKNGAYQAAIRYLGYRMRTVKEMRDYLDQKGFDPHISHETITRLMDEHLLDDLSFAESYVRSKMNTTAKGPGLIFKELRQKGISESMASASLLEYPYDRQYENALHFAEKKIQSSRSTSRHEQKRKVVVQLLQKGFDHDLISEVMNHIPEENTDQEWDALVGQATKAERKFRDLDLRTKHFKMKTFLYRKGFPLPLIEKYLDENLREI